MTESYNSSNAEEINAYAKLCEKCDEEKPFIFDKSFT
jgi:hypothetical protein